MLYDFAYNFFFSKEFAALVFEHLIESHFQLQGLRFFQSS